MGIPREIKLDGEYYALSPHSETPYRRYAQSPLVGQDKMRFWSTWPMRTWHGGERMKRFLNVTDMESGRYHDGEGVFVNEWGELTLQPALTRVVTVQSTTGPMVVSEDGTKVIVGLSVSPYAKIGTVSGSTLSWTDATGLTAGLVDIISTRSAYYAVTSGGAVMTSANGTAWSAHGAYTGAVGVAHVNSKLYVLKSTEVWDDAEDEQLSAIGGSYICGFLDNLYWGSNRRMYTYNGNADFEYRQFPDGFNMTGLLPYRMAIWVPGYYQIQGGYVGVVHYVMPGTENHLYTLGDYSSDHRIYALAGGDNEVWFASPKRGGADRFDLEEGGISCGPAWAAAGKIPFKGMAYFQGFLIVARYDNVAGTDGIYAANLVNPSTYRSSGWLTSADYDYGHSYNEKVIRSIRVEHDRLTAGQSIKIEYSTDRGSNWTTAGVSNLVGSDGQVFFIGAVHCTQLKLKITLNAGASATTTPKLRTVATQGAPKLDGTWRWELALVAFSKTRGAIDKGNLETSFKKATPLTFVDRSGAPYSVIIEDLEFQEIMVDKDSAIMLITLSEV